MVNEEYVAKDAQNGRPTTTDPTPTTRKEVRFQITKMDPLAQYPDRPNEYSIRLDGVADVPAGVGQTRQVAVYFFWNDGRNGNGQPVRGLQAACASQRYQMPGTDARFERITWIPYDAMHLCMGKWVADDRGQQQYADNYLVIEEQRADAVPRAEASRSDRIRRGTMIA